MKILSVVILLILGYNCTHNAQENVNNILEKRIKNAVLVISSDSLFQYFIESKHGKAKTFLVEDSTYIPFVTGTQYKFFYPDSSDKLLFDKYNKYQTIYFQETPYKNIRESIPTEFLNTESNYTIYVGFIETDLLGFLVFPYPSTPNNRVIQFFMLYDENESVKSYYSKEYHVTSSTYRVVDE
ncbi:MAG: hypothetical protein CVV22_12610 [Ignavibacteriae bacterium HGW-Ignavibacteriae-1]|jgi:hypothetical protein|nr:MAG: hypothetical protein CVV22_12610 [Ignavibacteriae bacterium HGW-Ignavibacteriae-1]